MAWTSLTFPFGSILTSAKMTNLYDNFTAMGNGDSGAPLVYPAAVYDEAGGTGLSVPKLLSRLTSPTDFTGTSVDTHWSFTLLGGLMDDDRCLRILAYGYTYSGDPNTVTYRLRIDGVDVVTWQVSNSDSPREGAVDLTLFAQGTGSQYYFGHTYLAGTATLVDGSTSFTLSTDSTVAIVASASTNGGTPHHVLTTAAAWLI